jgi:hypothetical protein
MVSGVLRQLLKHIHGSTGSHHLTTRIKKITSKMTIRRMIRIKTMIKTWITRTSGLAF